MLKQRYFLAAMMLSCLVAMPAMAVDTIADVKTLADLRAQPVIHLDNGCDVQIGMRDPDADAGPFKLIYCLSKATKAELNEETTGEYPLGPVSVDLVEGRTLAQKDKILSDHQISGAGEKLFCQILPVGWADDLTIRVSCEDKVLLEKKLGKSRHEPFYWTRFARRVRDNPDHQEVVIDSSEAAQCPTVAGGQSILRSWSGGNAMPSDPPLDAMLPGDGTLPGKWRQYFLPNAHADEMLALKIENDRFTIQAFDKFLNLPPEERLLARWWVNDTPVAAKPAAREEEKAYAFSGNTSRTDQFCVALGLPVFLGQLKVGDRVGLQLLYTPSLEQASTRQTARLMHHLNNDTNVPLLTNRLDLTVDEHWLTLVRK